MIDWAYIRQELGEMCRLVGFLALVMFALVGVFHVMSLVGV